MDVRNRGEVEHVARLQIPASEIDLLRSDLDRCFQVDRLAPYIPAFTGLVENGGRADEIDLSQFLKRQLERLRPVAPLLVREPGQRDPLYLGVAKRRICGSWIKMSMSWLSR